MADDASDSEKETLLTETINELRGQLMELNGKKMEAKQRLGEIRSKLETTQEEEHRTEARMKDILKVEARLEELMSEESRLLREQASAEEELLEIKGRLDKINRINKKIGGGDGN